MQNWHENQDVGNLTSTILSHLSKAYDNLTPWLSLPKLEAFDFIIESLQLIQNCISFRKQQVKIGGFFRRWVEILFGIPEGSILGPILFNIIVSYFSLLNRLIYAVLLTIILSIRQEIMSKLLLRKSWKTAPELLISLN